MVTEVGVRQIVFARLNLPTPKTRVWYKNQGRISSTRQVIANFPLKFPNFRCHGNWGWCEAKFTCTVKFADPENPLFGANTLHLSSKMSEL